MSLSDRLQAAAAVREGRTLPTRVHAPEALPAPALPYDLTIVLPPSGPAASTVAPDPEAAPGASCPTCGRSGEAGLIDLPGQTTDYSCSACGTMWRIRMKPRVVNPLLPPMR